MSEWAAMATRIEIIEADITTLAIDGIVNAANERLLGGGGVDGAIHRAAGPDLLEACRQVPEVQPGVRCPTGEARITPGFDLPARFVIHTVGPVWTGGNSDEDDLLASCYRNCIRLAGENKLAGIAFPAISTGVYGFPLERATRIALRTTCEALAEAPSIRRVVFACFDAATRSLYKRHRGLMVPSGRGDSAQATS